MSLCHASQLPVEVLQGWLSGVKTHHPYAASTITGDFGPQLWNMQALSTHTTASDEKTY